MLVLCGCAIGRECAPAAKCGRSGRDGRNRSGVEMVFDFFGEQIKLVGNFLVFGIEYWLAIHLFCTHGFRFAYIFVCLKPAAHDQMGGGRFSGRDIDLAAYAGRAAARNRYPLDNSLDNRADGRQRTPATKRG